MQIRNITSLAFAIAFAFAGSAPEVGGWTLQNPPQGRTASYEIVGSTVVVRIAYAAGVSI